MKGKHVWHDVCRLSLGKNAGRGLDSINITSE